MRNQKGVFQIASREELLASIKPDMKLDRTFFLKVYGYEISYPGFKDIAIKALKDAGCSKAEEYYHMVVSEYERKRDEELRPVARRWRKIWREEYEKMVREHNRKEGEEQRNKEITGNWMDGMF